MLLTSILKKNGKLFSISIHVTQPPPQGVENAVLGINLISRRRGMKSNLDDMGVESMINTKKGYLFNSKNPPDVYEEIYRPTTIEDLEKITKRLSPEAIARFSNAAQQHKLTEQFSKLIQRVLYR